MKLAWSRRARADLIGIFRYIADDDPNAADRWVRRLRERAAQAAKTPGIGRGLPELPARKDVREVLLKSYRIVYVVRSGTMEVLTVFEGHKRLPRDLG